MKRNDQQVFTVIDLFCGAGGFSQGFYQAGFKVLLGIDNDEEAIKTYGSNFPNSKSILADMRKMTGSSILSLARVEADKVDVIIGGPPCQGFSLSGKREIDDERNSLYLSFHRIVDEIRPKIFVMENVPGMVNLFKGQIKEKIISDFEKIGYKVFLKILTASDYGVPQHRKRAFFVGLNLDKYSEECFEYPLPEYGDGENLNGLFPLKPFVTTEQAISDLDFVPDDEILQGPIDYRKAPENEYQKSMRTGSRSLNNHEIILHKEKTRKIVSMVPDGGNYKDLPQELWTTRKVHIAWTRMNSKKPCFTIDTGHNHHFHYRANRVPTVRESARIQSFPDKFIFTGKKTSQLRQVGNAVPPLMAEALAKKITEKLEELKDV